MPKILKHFASPDLMSDLPDKQINLVTQVCLDETSLIETIKEGYDILLADGSVPLSAKLFEAGSQLQRVIFFDIGLIDRVDLVAATRHGVAVALPQTRSQNAVAEFTLALILMLQRHLVQALVEGRAGNWPRGTLDHLRGSEQKGSILGIIGWSRIGKLVAEKASALGMHILVYSPNANPNEITYPLLGLTELLEKADVVSLHTRLTPMNRHLIGENELRTMKPNAYLVNTARGALIDEAALVRALKENWIAGAALDVLEVEPPPRDHPLLHLQNTFITPHVAWNTIEVQALAKADIQEELRRAVAGELPQHCANPEVLHSKRR